MLAARGQENLAASHQHGAAVKQQQSQTSRQLAPKTPGAKYSKTPIKVPLNDENGARAMTSKAFKGLDKSNFATPMTQRARAVLGDKTTNAKAKGLPTVNVKSAVREIEQSQVKPQNTVRPRQREPHAETQKLHVHAEETDPLSEDEIEYCPPRAKDLPYESDVFPDGVLTFEALKPENRMKGYYQYYFNPIGEDGLSLRDRQLQEETRKSIEEGEKKIREDLDSFEWSVKSELEPNTAKVATKAPTSSKLTAPRKPLSTVRSRNAANVLSMDDTTKSMQRKAAKASELRKPALKKPSSLVMPGMRTSRRGSSQLASAPKKSAGGLEATSRTTIGYNKGRATASLLAGTKTPTANPRKNTSTLASATTTTTTQRGGLPRFNTTLSNGSDKTITPARYAHRQAPPVIVSGALEDSNGNDDDEDHAWRERVPFLAIFDDPDAGCDEGDDEDPFGIKHKAPALLDDDDEEEEEFELKLADE